MGRRIASDAEPVRRRTVGIEGYLDDYASGLLPAGAHYLLDFAQVRRPESVAVPHSQRAHARRLGGVAVARVARTWCSRGVARGSTLGAAPGDGAIGCVGNRVEKHSVVPVLPFVDPLLFEGGLGRNGQSPALAATWLGTSVFCHGDHEQTFHGDVAGRARPLYLVAQRSNPIA